MRDIQAELAKLITDNPVVLFMKGTPQMPMCGFSARTAAVLQECDVPFAAVNVLTDPDIREGVKVYGKWPTIPQLYVAGELVGGCDIATAMYENGELEPMLKAATAERS